MRSSTVRLPRAKCSTLAILGKSKPLWAWLDESSALLLTSPSNFKRWSAQTFAREYQTSKGHGGCLATSPGRTWNKDFGARSSSTATRDSRLFITVVGAGKMGLPLACQFAHRGAKVTVCDIRQDVVEAINAG